jgi:recombinational DNA repair ATPase RecF
MTDDTIIKSARAIAKARRTTVSAINEAIDRWADQAITDKARKHGLALELAGLDELEEVFYQRALEGDVKVQRLPMALFAAHQHPSRLRLAWVGSRLAIVPESGKSVP